MKFKVTNRFTGEVQFTADIKCDKDESTSVKLGLAVKWAIENRAYLNGAYLNGAYLNGAYLNGADLSRAYLNGAYLSGANLSGAYLNGAYLNGANLSGADLSRAYLNGAYLSGANLNGAYLNGADLNGADLSRANLSRAYLNGAYLNGAYLNGAYLSGAKNSEYAIACTRILPDGDLIGWKKCNDDVIVKLKIPADARRSHAFGRKCRAEFADVVEVSGAQIGVTDRHGPRTEYRTGERVTPDQWCEDFTQECAGGIHFYITRAEAESH